MRRRGPIEQVRLVGAGAADAVLELHEVVARARHHGAHAGLRVDALRELLRDRERDGLVARAGLADGARVLAAVPGVDRDHEVALPVAAGHLEGRRRSGRERVAEVDDEAMAIGFRSAA